MLRWYVLKIKTRFINDVFSALHEFNIEYFYPKFPYKQRIRGVERQFMRPFFPGYIFIFSEPKAFDRILMTRGVQKLLGATHSFISYVPCGVMNQLIEMVEKKQLPLPEENYDLKIGDPIKVESGPFAGHIGEVSRVKKNRVVIFLTLLSGKVEVILPRDLVSRRENA